MKKKLSLWNYPQYTLAITVMCIIQVILIALSTKLFQNLADTLEGGDKKTVFIKAGIYVGLEFVLIFINYFNYVTKYKILELFGIKIRNALFSSILGKKDTAAWKRHPKEYYISLLIQDLRKYFNAYVMNQMTFLTLILRFMMFTVLLFSFHWLLGGIVFLSIIGMYLLNEWYDKRVEIFSKDKMEEDEEYLKKYEDEVEGFAEYSFAGKKEVLLQRLKLCNKKKERDTLTYEKNMQRIFFVQSFVKKGANSVILALIFCLGLQGKISIGIIISSFSLFSMIWEDIEKFIPVVQELHTSYPIFQKLEQELKEEEPVLELKEEIQQLELKNISFSYQKDKNILSNINLVIEKGRKYALMGASGSGKTTLLRIISGMEDAYEGTVYLNGKPLKKEEHYSFPGLIYITQDVYLFDDTILNNICFGNAEYEERLNKNGYYELLVKHFGSLQRQVENNGTNISGGQRQMIAVARAIASGKKFYIFDESFSAVDLNSFQVIWGFLKEDLEATCICVTHRMEEAILCDTIIDMEKQKGDNANATVI